MRYGDFLVGKGLKEQALVYMADGGNDRRGGIRYLLQYIYCVNGALELLKEWVGSGFPIDERKFAEIIMRMSMQASSLDNVAL